MKYEIVQMEKKIVAGFSDVTSNESADMTSKIGALWQNFFCKMGGIKNRKNGRTIGLYTDYGIPSKEDYTVVVGAEVTSCAENGEFVTKEIPAGRYAKFTIHGDVKAAVGEAWGEIWNTPLERLWTGDYEEYHEDCASGSGTIDIYLAVK